MTKDQTPSREEVTAWARKSGLGNILGIVEGGALHRFFALAYAAGAEAERDRMCEQLNISKEFAREKAKSNEAD